MTAVDVTCPKCATKLRLDEPPAADELIECPKCEHQFAPAPPPAVRKELPADLKKKSAAPPPGKNGKGKKGTAAPRAKKKGVKKKKSNPYFLTLMIGGALVILACVGAMGYLLFSSSGKLTEMLSYCPAESNVIRGCNVGLIARYPGYMAEATKQTAGPVDECAAVLAKACGHAEADFLDYMIVAKVKGRPAGTVYVLRSRTKFDPNGLAAELGAETQVNGIRCFRPKGKSGAMANAAVLVPTDRLFVVVAGGGGQEQFLQAAANGGPKQIDNTLAGKMTDAGWRITKGHIWQMVRAEGDMANYNKELADTVEKAFKNVADQMRAAKTTGTWMSFGAGGYRLGAAMDCADKEAAAGIADSMNTGPISKGDDSEVPRELKSATQVASSRDFPPYFLGNIKFKYTGSCAWFETKVIREKIQTLSAPFNNPAMGDTANAGGGLVGR